MPVTLPDASLEANLSMLDDLELNSCDVWILGGGISGLTTAIVLQSLGLKPAILTESAPGKFSHQQDPLVPTAYAMASAYPHNLRVFELNRISDDSQAVFGQLCRQPSAGVRLYQMFEVFEHQPDTAALGMNRLNFQLFDGKPAQLKNSVAPPCRPGAEYLWGWTFQTYFADMPLYLKYLWSRFQERGGTLRLGKLSVETILAGRFDKPLVNCLGLGAVAAFCDRSPANIMRGRQVLVPGAPVVTNNNGLPVAYNYTPPVEFFARYDGLPEYVHYFPREDGWLLGQTREPGSMDEKGTWHGKAVSSQQILIGGQTIPAPIIDLNSSLLKNWLGLEFSRDNLVARTGYRYYRDPDDTGVKLDTAVLDGVPIVHNYGHGGSGVTMSWGCSVQCARLLEQYVGLKRNPADGLEQAIVQLLSEPSAAAATSLPLAQPSAR
jgi:D-amino-acid oxidase